MTIRTTSNFTGDLDNLHFTISISGLTNQQKTNEHFYQPRHEDDFNNQNERKIGKKLCDNNRKINSKNSAKEIKDEMSRK